MQSAPPQVTGNQMPKVPLPQANPSDTVDKIERLVKLRDTKVLVQDDY
jgi:hypothetical protein